MVADGVGTATLGKRGDIKDLLAALKKRKDPFLDLRIICEDGEISCHRMVVGAHSKFLRDILTSVGESSEDKDGLTVIHLPQVSHNLMKIVVKFLYSGRLVITQAQVPRIKVLLERILKIDATIQLPNVEDEADLMDSSPPRNEPPDGGEGGSGGSSNGNGGGGSSPGKFSHKKFGSSAGGSNGNTGGGWSQSMDTSMDNAKSCSSPSEITIDMAPPSPPDSITGEPMEDIDIEENVLDGEDDGGAGSPKEEANSEEVFVVDGLNDAAAVRRKSTEAPNVLNEQRSDGVDTYEIACNEGGISEAELPDPALSSSESPRSGPSPVDSPAGAIMPNEEDSDSREFKAAKTETPVEIKSKLVAEAPKIIAKRPGASNPQYFARKSTAPPDPEALEKKRRKRKRRKLAKRAKKLRIDPSLLEDTYVSSSSSSDDCPSEPSRPTSPSPDDEDLPLPSESNEMLLLNLPPPVPLPPEPGTVLYRGTWIKQERFNKLMANKEARKNGKPGPPKKYNYQPFINTITGMSKIETVAAMEQEEDGEHKCPFCDEVYARERSLKSHMSRSHNERSTVPCPEGCGKMLSSKTAIKKHLLSHRPSNEWPYICRLCGKTFQAKGDLPKHWLTKAHKDDAPKPNTPEFKDLLAMSVRVPNMSDTKCGSKRPINLVAPAANDEPIPGPSSQVYAPYGQPGADYPPHFALSLAHFGQEQVPQFQLSANGATIGQQPPSSIG